MPNNQSEEIKGEDNLIQEVFASYFGVENFPVQTLTNDIRTDILRAIHESRKEDPRIISDFIPFQEAICYIEKLPELERIARIRQASTN